MQGNPYTPGAGCTPLFLAGRENILSEAQSSIESLSNYCIPQRSQLYYGLRGVGKTVLLNAIKEFAQNNGLLYAYIEAVENDKVLKDRLLKLIHSFSLVYDLKEYTYSMEVSSDDAATTGIYEDDLTEIFTTLGRLATKCSIGICFLIDEVQFLDKQQMRSIITALHRCNQLRLPILFFAAGLPEVVSTINASCSYAERLFVYHKIGSLSSSEAREAIVKPAKAMNVNYEEDAIQQIVAVTQGYPYFIQEFCSTIWNDMEPSPCITLKHVINSMPHFYTKLNKGFFETRYSRCSSVEKSFLIAMANMEALPCAIAEVVNGMGETLQQMSPARATLINKGIIYSPARGYVDFTVPLFDQYLKRVCDGGEDDVS